MMGAGALTVAVALSTGTSQYSPIAFHYSSSWSRKPFMAASTVYTIV
jgi:hypothetical protein